MAFAALKSFVSNSTCRKCRGVRSSNPQQRTCKCCSECQGVKGISCKCCQVCQLFICRCDTSSFCHVCKRPNATCRCDADAPSPAAAAAAALVTAKCRYCKQSSKYCICRCTHNISIYRACFVKGCRPLVDGKQFLPDLFKTRTNTQCPLCSGDMNTSDCRCECEHKNHPLFCREEGCNQFSPDYPEADKVTAIPRRFSSRKPLNPVQIAFRKKCADLNKKRLLQSTFSHWRQQQSQASQARVTTSIHTALIPPSPQAAGQTQIPIVELPSHVSQLHEIVELPSNVSQLHEREALRMQRQAAARKKSMELFEANWAIPIRNAQLDKIIRKHCSDKQVMGSAFSNWKYFLERQRKHSDDLLSIIAAIKDSELVIKSALHEALSYSIESSEEKVFAYRDKQNTRQSLTEKTLSYLEALGTSPSFVPSENLKSIVNNIQFLKTILIPHYQNFLIHNSQICALAAQLMENPPSSPTIEHLRMLKEILLFYSKIHTEMQQNTATINTLDAARCYEYPTTVANLLSACQALSGIVAQFLPQASRSEPIYSSYGPASASSASISSPLTLVPSAASAMPASAEPAISKTVLKIEEFRTKIAATLRQLTDKHIFKPMLEKLTKQVEFLSQGEEITDIIAQVSEIQIELDFEFQRIFSGIPNTLSEEQIGRVNAVAVLVHDANLFFTYLQAL